MPAFTQRAVPRRVATSRKFPPFHPVQSGGPQAASATVTTSIRFAPTHRAHFQTFSRAAAELLPSRSAPRMSLPNALRSTPARTCPVILLASFPNWSPAHQRGVLRLRDYSGAHSGCGQYRTIRIESACFPTNPEWNSVGLNAPVSRRSPSAADTSDSEPPALCISGQQRACGTDTRPIRAWRFRSPLVSAETHVASAVSPTPRSPTVESHADRLRQDRTTAANRELCALRPRAPVGRARSSVSRMSRTRTLSSSHGE